MQQKSRSSVSTRRREPAARQGHAPGKCAKSKNQSAPQREYALPTSGDRAMSSARRRVTSCSIVGSYVRRALALTHYHSVATLDCVSSKQSAAGLNGRFSRARGCAPGGTHDANRENDVACG